MHDRAPAAEDAATACPAPDEEVDPRTVTAIPGDHDVSALVLICDHCGRAHNRPDEPAVRWRALWEQAVAAGWHGLDRPVGPHFCFRCAD
ncbi:hypothetical protein ADK67_34475 [Saccharothrix sp. NRRL B-16348]|uniref:hypothetical protein n=1 Tax=Saccharothrix sp. NRRL B-16348 TaxID=1415542 RepID=UPI0006AE3A3C|nr:hypothetical protein [Saccharothrix sp. NRRL B-16348]KOX18991.1 hypothetical protein ADK67_34475 [Saccharothrix sp. NRRL B-16348]